MDPLLPVDALRFTRDRRELAEKIAQARRTLRRSTCRRAAPPRTTCSSAATSRACDPRSTISALQVGGGPSRQHQGRTQVDHLRQRRADRARASISCTLLQRADRHREQQQHRDLHARSARADRRQRPTSCGRIAENTGAEAFVNTNTPEKALRQVVQRGQRLLSARLLVDAQPAGRQVPPDRRQGEAPGHRRARAQGLLGAERHRARESAGRGGGRRGDSRRRHAARWRVLSTARPERLVDVWVGARSARRRSAERDGGVDAARQRPSRDPTRTVSLAVKGAGGDRSFDARLDAGVLSPSSRRRGGAVVSSRCATPPATSSMTIGGRLPCRTCRRRTLRSPPPWLLRARTVAEARAIAAGGGRCPSPAANSTGPIICSSGLRSTARPAATSTCRRG